MLTGLELRAALWDLAEQDMVCLRCREDAEQVWHSIPQGERPFYHVRECHILQGWLVERERAQLKPAPPHPRMRLSPVKDLRTLLIHAADDLLRKGRRVADQ
jgi:hypothetical protein